MTFRTVRRAFVGAVAATLALSGGAGASPLPAPTTAPSAATTASSSPVIGGARLASHGLLVDAAHGTPPLPTGLTASSWLVADLDTGAVLAARNPHGRYRPASTLKILTALVLLARIGPAAAIRVHDGDVRVAGTRIGLVPGLRYPAAQLFAALLIGSASDAAYALSNAAGGLPATVGEMNAQALRLDALDTVAKTPDGVDADGQSSSAYDLALISRAALARSDFRGYVAAQRAFVGPSGHTIEVDSHNPLLGSYPGIFGVKNGFTTKALYTYVGVARRGGRTVLVTLMHANYTWASEAKSLLDWGFVADGSVTPVGVLFDPLAPPPTGSRAAPAGPALAAASADAAKPGTSTSAGLIEAVGAALLASVLLLRVRAVRRSRRRPLRLPRL